MYVYRASTKTWYENKDKYSVSTSKQQTQLRPNLFIKNAFHMKTTLDWSFASAMGLMLLTGVLDVYWIYNKLVGIDNIK